jgi:hypothetical protein
MITSYEKSDDPLVTLILPSNQKRAPNIKENVVVQPDENIYVITQPE